MLGFQRVFESARRSINHLNGIFCQYARCSSLKFWYFFIYQIFQIDIYLSGVQLTVQLRSMKLEHSTDARRAISFTAWCYHPIGIC
mgnify:CR=1 FL=1